MFTSYFGNRKLQSYLNSQLVSIAVRTPINVRVYRPLLPSWRLVKSYKTGLIDEEEYVKIYYNENLSNLNPRKVFNELGKDSILLCYEKPGVFCHRHIVAKWLENNLNIEVLEL